MPPITPLPVFTFHKITTNSRLSMFRIKKRTPTTALNILRNKSAFTYLEIVHNEEGKVFRITKS